MILNDFILLLKKATQLNDVQFNADGICRLCIDDNVMLTLKWQDNIGLWLSAGIIAIDDLSQTQVFHVLSANAYGQGVGEGQFAIESMNAQSIQGAQLVYQLQIKVADLSIALFIEQLERIIGFSKTWRQQLSLPAQHTNSVAYIASLTRSI